MVTVWTDFVRLKEKIELPNFFFYKIRLLPPAQVKNTYSWLRSRQDAAVAAEGSFFEKIISLQPNNSISIVEIFWFHLFLALFKLHNIFQFDRGTLYIKIELLAQIENLFFMIPCGCDYGLSHMVNRKNQ